VRRRLALWVVATVVSVFAAFVSAAPAVMSFMLFDAPGSDSSPLTVALFFCALTLPLFCLAGAGVPWMFRATRMGTYLFLIPFVDIAAIVVVLVLMQTLCGGSFSCR
jgi:hypothetical protein